MSEGGINFLKTKKGGRVGSCIPASHPRTTQLWPSAVYCSSNTPRPDCTQRRSPVPLDLKATSEWNTQARHPLCVCHAARQSPPLWPSLLRGRSQPAASPACAALRSSPPSFERLQCMGRPRNAPRDLPRGRPVARGGSRPRAAPRRPSGLPPRPRGKNRRVAPARPGLTPSHRAHLLFACHVQRARVLATARRPLLRPRLPAPRDQGKGRRPHVDLDRHAHCSLPLAGR